MANVRRTDDCSAAEMLSRMRFILSTKNWQNVEISCAHWGGGVVVHDLVSAVQQSLCRSPGGTNIAGRFVEF